MVNRQKKSGLRAAMFSALLLVVSLLEACAAAPQPPQSAAAQTAAAPQTILPARAAAAPTPASGSTAGERAAAPAAGPAVKTAAYAPSSPSSLAYTIAWMSDTQHYSAGYPDTFLAMTRYLRARQGALGIGYIVHTGDIVASGKSETEWKRARAAMDELAGIPNGVLAGNHDRSGDGYGNYLKYFGKAYYAGNPWYGGNYRDNINHYDLIALGVTKYVFVYLSYEPDGDAIAWANAVFRAYPDRVGVLCTHDYLDGNSSLRSMGRTLRQKVVAASPNVYLVLCGHRYTEDEVPVRFDDNGDGIPDRTVYQCIANYQALTRGGSGYIRFLAVDEAAGTIRFYTYSPVLGAYGAPPAQATCRTDTLPIPWKLRRAA